MGQGSRPSGFNIMGILVIVLGLFWGLIKGLLEAKKKKIYELYIYKCKKYVTQLSNPVNLSILFISFFYVAFFINASAYTCITRSSM